MQQVNFFKSEFKTIDPPFSAAILLIVLGYSVIFSLLISIALMFIATSKKEEVETKRTQLDNLNGQLEQTRRKYPVPKIDGKLIAQVDVLRVRASKNKRVLEYLENREMNISQQSFSTMLDGLSKIQQKNLWLTQIEILKGGQQIRLIGSTLYAASLPEYLKKLSEISSFVDLEFEVFEMTRTESGLNFIVSSKRDDNENKEELEDI
ncbi:MAG: hypothetical protein ACJA0E_000474 [Bermanella sp.]|jgi:hypothetical protein